MVIYRLYNSKYCHETLDSLKYKSSLATLGYLFQMVTYSEDLEQEAIDAAKQNQK